jgi:nucleoside-diphosphate-sugar epimerase
VKCLALPAAQIDGKVFNAGYQNLSLDAIADKVRDIVGPHVEIVHTPTDDNRSYHISSEKILRELGFTPRFTIEDAIRELVEAFRAGKIPDSFTSPLYFNIKRMQEIHLR